MSQLILNLKIVEIIEILGIGQLKRMMKGVHASSPRISQYTKRKENLNATL